MFSEKETHNAVQAKNRNTARKHRRTAIDYRLHFPLLHLLTEMQDLVSCILSSVLLWLVLMSNFGSNVSQVIQVAWFPAFSDLCEPVIVHSAYTISSCSFLDSDSSCNILRLSRTSSNVRALPMIRILVFTRRLTTLVSVLVLQWHTQFCVSLHKFYVFLVCFCFRRCDHAVRNCRQSAAICRNSEVLN